MTLYSNLEAGDVAKFIAILLVGYIGGLEGYSPERMVILIVGGALVGSAIALVVGR